MIDTRKSVLICLGVSFLLLSGCLPNSFLITPVSTDRGLEEKVLQRDSWLAFDKIAVVDIDGLIVSGRAPTLFGEGDNPVSRLLEQLDKARKDDRVKAVLVRINSPGGAVTASGLMYDEIRYFRDKSGKPVVAVMMDVAASGGYYVACACDEIVAQPTTVTGSIGVIMQTFDASGTLQKIGLASDAITSGPHKDSGSPLRQMRPQERELFQQIVDDMYEKFVAVVVKGRPRLDEARVRSLADGRVYTAGQALECGLIDRIATLRETVDVLKQRVGADKVQLVTYRKRYEHAPNFYAGPVPAAPGAPGSAQFHLTVPFPPAAGTPQFLYLWAPGL
ncbi:MAG: signal peptide peptidase SppA [Phycisphaerales bacterium]|nr:MAG: signal peptide peptidase SppA [Phycisphaerales bacterium]